MGAGRPLGLNERQWRLVRYLFLLAAAGGILLALGDGAGRRQASAPGPPLSPTAGPTAPAVASEEAAFASYTEELERELEATLGQVEGVGRVKVFVTLERGVTQIPLFNETREVRFANPGAGGGGSAGGSGGGSGAVTEQRVMRQPVLLRSSDGRNEVPAVVAEERPRVQGVMVVADGAADPGVRWMILQAVETVLQVPAHRVSVLAKRQ